MGGRQIGRKILAKEKEELVEREWQGRKRNW